MNLQWGLIVMTAMISISSQDRTPYGHLPLHARTKVEPCLQWTGGCFSWPCKSTKSIFLGSGKHNPKNVIATRAQILRDEVFVALPRYRPGVAATLARTPLKRGSCETTLTPFPCWTMQETGKCTALQSVVDLVLDSGDVLWVLDTGIIDSLEDPKRTCPPKVVAFNTKTGRVLKSISLENLTTSRSRLQYLAVDYDRNNRVFVYVSDAASRAIIVYDVLGNRGFRVILPSAVTQGGAKRDVLYIALVRKTCGSTELFFTYLGSKRMFSIRTEYLRQGSAQGRVQDVGEKPQRLVLIGTDNGSALFFRNEGHSEVYRWDTNTCFKEENFRIVYRCQTCQLATHAMADYKRGKMRVLESNFPDYMQKTVGCGAVQQLTLMQGCW